MPVEIIYIREDVIASWLRAVDAVARERRYLGRVDLSAIADRHAFPRKMIVNDWPMYCAVDGEDVVGWADVSPSEIPECAHRGTLGMGVIASHRGQGIGARLLEACLAHAPRSGIEKVELIVYTNNAPAVALYRKYDFTETGLIPDYRRLDGEIYDALLMELRTPPGRTT